MNFLHIALPVREEVSLIRLMSIGCSLSLRTQLRQLILSAGELISRDLLVPMDARTIAWVYMRQELTTIGLRGPADWLR